LHTKPCILEIRGLLFGKKGGGMINRIDVKEGQDGNETIPIAWRISIENADVRARELLELLSADLDSIYNQSGTGSTQSARRVAAWNANTNIVRWFGASRVNSQQISYVIRRVQKIVKNLDDGVVYVVIKEQSGKKSHNCNATTSAYVIPPFGNKIHLCPIWFGHSLDVQASLIAHEIVHKLGFLGKIHHGGTSKGDALTRAIDHPSDARKSPYNYQYLLQEY